MSKETGTENKQFELHPVGKIKKERGHTYVCLLPDYRAALKHLELFSHALIFFKAENGLPAAEMKAGRSHSGLKPETVKILKAELKRGVVEIDGFVAGDGVPVFDIKPYFPCEDRVRDVVVPDIMSEWPEWKTYEAGPEAPGIDGIHGLSDMGTEGRYPVHEVAVIRKIGGEHYLELNGLAADLLSHINGFSHIRVLWWFDKFDKSTYRRTTECKPPYEKAPRTGVFATRSPVRPNPIAITTVRVRDIDLNNNCIRISQVDSFDKTPVIDIIPYIPAYDRVREFYVPEWLQHWPEWVDERESGSGPHPVEIIESDIKKINKYMPGKEPDADACKGLPEEMPQAGSKFAEAITVNGARQNNLKDISCRIPKNKLTVITGVSGSGKSSLAFDTIYAESQRRFMDSLSGPGRGLFEQMEKPDFDQITGLPPAVAIEQKTAGRNPRSTVGTMTDIYDYLRLLFAKIGTRHCPECGRAVVALKTDEIICMLAGMRPGTFFRIRGFSSETVVGEFFIQEETACNADFVKELKACVQKALLAGNGAIVVKVNEAEVFMFQTKEMCYHCNRVFFELTTSDFSFNNPESMCPICKGLGVKLEVDADLIVANPGLSVLDGASAWWGNLRKHRQKPNANWMRGEILALAGEMGEDLELPWKALSESFRRQALYGSGGRKVRLVYENANGRKGEIVRPVEGAYNAITRLFRENNGESANRLASSFMRESKCSGCRGERLSAEGRLVEIAGTRFPETVVMTIGELKDWVGTLPYKLSEEEMKISLQLLKEMKKRLEHLMDVGVSYLTLDRPVTTLSGGEARRLRLAAQLGSGITNILYVLDEPSIGLHPKDHKKLIQIMHRLRDEGNTVIVVEHDGDTMLAADRIIDMGPGAGVHGGLILAEGTPEEIMESRQSETGKYLKMVNEVRPSNTEAGKKVSGRIKISGARQNNLKRINVSVPLGLFTCVTGVSGSGKSTLVLKTLYPALEKFLGKSEGISGGYDRIEGMEGLDKIIAISQHPIGRTPRSNPATYTGVFDDIRSLFASLDASKKKGYKQNKFSFNSKEGQCEACGGEGRKCVQMHFMPDVWVECPVCRGKRFNAETLEVRHNGKTIADVLDMNVEEALEFFRDNPKIKKVLQTLSDVGLGYIKLGQSALTLSGGEAQRIKLAKELSKSDTGRTMYLLDEPTTGLHFADIQNLLSILYRITQSGNTVLVIEHNLDVIKHADWIIDLGPEGGDAGGYVVAQGTPQEVAGVTESHTGQYLKNSPPIHPFG